MPEVTYKWINGEVPEDLEIKQVYGIVFDENFNVFLRKYEGQYFLTGGRPEPFDKTREDTLRREFLEEANMTIKNIHMLGYQFVEEGNGTKPYAQIRMIAQVDKIGENRPDTDNGKLYERLFVSPAQAIKLLNWEEVGKAQIEEGYRLAKMYYDDEQSS